MKTDNEFSESARVRVAETELLLKDRDCLIHDLEVHQAELEAQNQQLRDTQHLLEESTARYSDLYDFAPVGYCTLDLAGAIIEINLTGVAMLGSQRSRVVGKPFAVYVSEPERAAFRMHLDRRWSSPQGPAVVELTLVGAAKRPIVVQMVSTVVRNRGGAIVGCRSAFSDITEQKRTEEALRLAVRMREEFLAIVSHDLRNPLHSITLGSEILLTSPTLRPETVGTIGLIHRTATRMSRMLSDLLDLSSMDAGHLSMNRKSENVEAMLSTVVETASPSAVVASVRLEIGVDETNLVAFCDRDRILQVLMNLIDNAIKFTGSKGCIRIEARRRLDKVEFAVRDSGTGIAKPQLDHIFDPYWQAGNTAKMGTGLGLSIARGIVEFHGGRIWAESDVGRGSSFLFSLPSAPTQPTQLARNRRRTDSGPLSGVYPIVELSQERPPGDTVLIVDDEPDVHCLLRDLLKAEGYNVVAAADGSEALDYLRAANTMPFVILLDLVMPNMDGWQFIAERSRDARLVKIPVVLISGQFAARETARSLGLASCIEKPIAVASLREMLSKLRDRSPLAHA